MTMPSPSLLGLDSLDALLLFQQSQNSPPTFSVSEADKVEAGGTVKVQVELLLILHSSVQDSLVQRRS